VRQAPLVMLMAVCVGWASAHADNSDRTGPEQHGLKPILRSQQAQTYDVVIAGGRIHDGSGGPSYVADIGIKDGHIAAIGQLQPGNARVIQTRGLAVAPGFINMLSWATDCLLVDGRSQSDIRQGVTLEVMGEGWSMGPLNGPMKQDMILSQGDIKFPVEWTTLGEYLDYLVKRGVSTNVASFVGATTLRAYAVGYDDRPPTARELQQMRLLARAAMQEGALGVSSALIYAPASYARADELTALAEVAGQFGGLYISHIRSEGDRLLEALDELIATARKANVAAELYHMKAAGKSNWDKCEAMIQKIEKARAEGLRITADMYTYTAGATGLDAAMPPWVQEGGLGAWVTRLRNPAIRQRVLKEMVTPSSALRVEGVPPSNRGQDARDTEAPSGWWENFYLLAGSPENILLVGFKNEKLKPLTGKTLAQVAALRGKSPPETAIDLVIEDESRVNTVYFLMSEENVKKQIQCPWVSFCSDAGSLAPEGVFLKSSTHPRAYGNFARLLGKYVREEKVIPLEEAIRRLTSLPARNLKLDRRGKLEKGCYADVVVFDPATVSDRATYENPRQYATGMVHVFVNGIQVLKDGEHTGAKPGQVVHGPGWTGKAPSK
jgi:N-acyl-D-amino-acid deacylase